MVVSRIVFIIVHKSRKKWDNIESSGLFCAKFSEFGDFCFGNPEKITIFERFIF